MFSNHMHCIDSKYVKFRDLLFVLCTDLCRSSECYNWTNFVNIMSYCYICLIRLSVRQILFTALWPETFEKQTRHSHLLVLHRFDFDTRFSKKKSRNWKEKENSPFITDFTWIHFPIQIFFYKVFLVRQPNSAVSDQLWLSTGCKHFAIRYKGKGREWW